MVNNAALVLSLWLRPHWNRGRCRTSIFSSSVIPYCIYLGRSLADLSTCTVTVSSFMLGHIVHDQKMKWKRAQAKELKKLKCEINNVVPSTMWMWMWPIFHAMHCEQIFPSDTSDKWNRTAWIGDLRRWDTTATMAKTTQPYVTCRIQSRRQ